MKGSKLVMKWVMRLVTAVHVVPWLFGLVPVGMIPATIVKAQLSKEERKQLPKGNLWGFVLIGGLLQGLKPEPVMTVTEWAESKRMLDSKGAAEPGPYRVSRTPYTKEIQDDMSSQSPVETVVVMKAVQLGLTEVGFNIIGYYVDMAPCPLMYIMPTVDTMQRNVKQRINPMIENSPALADKIGKKRSRDGGNTLAQKDFPGGTLFMTGANSAASLRSVPVRVLIADEVDGYPTDVQGEGSPISLVMNRQLTFGDKKKTFMPSTPGTEGASIIEAEFKKTDQRYYFVPCPHCKKKQTLVMEQLRWVKDAYEATTNYECVHCRKAIPERYKTWMMDLSRAEWRPTNLKYLNRKKKGYHINGLYSPEGWLSWARIAQMYDECENDEPKKISFINTIEAKTYAVKGEAPPWQVLMERSHDLAWERGMVMSDVVFITAGADVQADRIEVKVKGWMKGRCGHEIDYRVLMGDTTKQDVWDMLGELLEGKYYKVNGGTIAMPIRLMCVDANFNSAFVHDFCRKYGPKRVIPIQGRDALGMPFSAPKSVNVAKSGKKVGKLKVWGVGSSYLKTQFYGWLRLDIDTETGEVPAGYQYFLPHGEEYFRGLTAEELVPDKDARGYIMGYKWVKKYERNEPLDTDLYALAAAYVVGFDRWSVKRWDDELRKSNGSITIGVGSSFGGAQDDNKRNELNGFPHMHEEDVTDKGVGDKPEKREVLPDKVVAVVPEEQKKKKKKKPRADDDYWGRY